MTTWYLDNTPTSPGVTDPGSVANTPIAGMGNFANYTPGRLISSATGIASAIVTVGNNATRGMLWVTEPGDPGLTLFERGGFRTNLKVTTLIGTAGTISSTAVLVNARILRLDSNNVIQQAGSLAVAGSDTGAFSVSDALPYLLTMTPDPFGNWTPSSATDRLGLQVTVQDTAAQTGTLLAIEVGTPASYLSSDVALQTIESFDHLAAFSNANSGVLCNTGGNPTCGAAISALKSPLPGRLLGADGGWGAAGYTVVAGWNGDGHAIEAPDNVTFFKQNTIAADTWIIGFRFKTTTLAAAQQVITVGTSAGGRSVSVDLNTSGQFEIWRDGGNPGAGTKLATSTETVATNTWYHIEYSLYMHPTLGSAEVRLNGTPVTLTWVTGTAGTQNTNAEQRACTWDNADATIDDVYPIAGSTSGFKSTDHLATPGRLPRFSTLLPVSQGGQQDFDRYSGTDGGNWAFVGGGDSTNHTYVDDVYNDGLLSSLRSVTTGSQDSWIMAALDSEADEIIAFVTSLASVGTGTNINIHEVWLGGTAYQIDDLGAVLDAEYEQLNTGAQLHYTERLWTAKPDGSGAWAPSDFAALEFGVGSFSAVDIYCSQARAMVLWYEAQAVSVDTGLWTLPMLGVGW